MDPTSLSNGDCLQIKHSSIKWDVNFDNKTLKGNVTHSITVVKPCKAIVLDTVKINVEKVILLEEKAQTQLKYNSLSTHKTFGTPIEIVLPNEYPKGSELNIIIFYETAKGDDCSALQWLPKEQTADKKFGFMFSQCQAIHCRAILPCFDYPAQKFTYDAEVTVPEGSGCTALMSAVATKSEANTFYFSQETAIPSYLLAICVGVLSRSEVSERCALYAEESLIEACAYEFAETESFLKTAEKIMGPYEWKRYDLLILPPSFPYGGMENPCLTFVTPTLLAKDRSLVNVVAHEIAHSWTGNLVTNASWDHFWLNEGFTRFFEAKIYARTLYPSDTVKEKQLFDFQALMSWDVLVSTVNDFGAEHHFTCLRIDHSRDGGIDPDDAFSSIPYEKGMALLVTLERLVGGPVVFEEFMREYIANFKNKALTSKAFVLFFNNYFIKAGKEAAIKDFDWDTWFHSPGLPASSVKDGYDRTLYDKAKAVGSNWLKKQYVSRENFYKLSTDEKITAFEAVKGSEKDLDCQKLEEVYKFSEVDNAEVLFVWFMACIKKNYEEIIDDKLIGFLRTIGRLKFARPLYKTLFEQGGKFKDIALTTFQDNKESYHAITQKMIARDLGLE